MTFTICLMTPRIRWVFVGVFCLSRCAKLWALLLYFIIIEVICWLGACDMSSLCHMIEGSAEQTCNVAIRNMIVDIKKPQQLLSIRCLAITRRFFLYQYIHGNLLILGRLEEFTVNSCLQDCAEEQCWGLPCVVFFPSRKEFRRCL